MAERPIWLVLTKIDLLDAERLDELVSAMNAAFAGRQLFCVSALSGAGLPSLTGAVMAALSEWIALVASDAAARAREDALAERILQDATASALAERRCRSPQSAETDAPEAATMDGLKS